MWRWLPSRHTRFNNKHMLMDLISGSFCTLMQFNTVFVEFGNIFHFVCLFVYDLFICTLDLNSKLDLCMHISFFF